MAQFYISRHQRKPMPKRVEQDELNEILDIVTRHPRGASIEDIQSALAHDLPRRTLQRRLALLSGEGRLIAQGRARATRYGIPKIAAYAGIKLAPLRVEAAAETYIPISPAGEDIKQAVRQPVQNRRPTGYNQQFLKA